jgi:hypothetical protein
MNILTPFDLRIANSPYEWRGPLTEVIDTADAVRLAMEDWGIESPELLLGLTQLVLQRFDAAQLADAPSDANYSQLKKS